MANINGYSGINESGNATSSCSLGRSCYVAAATFCVVITASLTAVGVVKLRECSDTPSSEGGSPRSTLAPPPPPPMMSAQKGGQQNSPPTEKPCNPIVQDCFPTASPTSNHGSTTSATSTTTTSNLPTRPTPSPTPELVAGAACFAAGWFVGAAVSGVIGIVAAARAYASGTNRANNNSIDRVETNSETNFNPNAPYCPANGWGY